jgi:hypothetical protein
MKPDAVARWEKCRALGKTRHILIYGVGPFVVPVIVGLAFFAYRADLNPTLLGVSAVFLLAVGALYGLASWHIFERQYIKAKPQLGG